MSFDAAQTIELSRFRVNERNVSQLVERWPVLLAALRSNYPGFVDAHLARLDADTWTYIGYWTSVEACQLAMTHAVSVPAITGWLGLIDGEPPVEFGELVPERPSLDETR